MFTGLAAADNVAYTQTAFDKLQSQGSPILVSIHADWCPTCRAQAPIVDKLLKQAKIIKALMLYGGLRPAKIRSQCF